MSQLKLAIIGATGSGLKRTIPSLINSSTVRVVAIQARNPDKLAKVQQQYGIERVFTDVTKMIEDGGFDAIYIATPPFLHLENITAAIVSGKPIICEKPLAQNLKEAQRIHAILEKNNSPFMLAHHLRHQQALRDIKLALCHGEIGVPTAAWCQWGFQLNQNAPNAVWKLDSELGGGNPFTDAGIHIIDIAISLFGKPIKIAAHGFKLDSSTTIDNTTAILCYDKCTVTLNASQDMPHAGNHILIYGTKGSIEAFGAIGEKSIKRVRFCRNGVEETRDYSDVNLYGAEVEDFAAFLAGTSETQEGTSLNEAILGMTIIDAIKASSETNKYIPL